MSFPGNAFKKNQALNMLKYAQTIGTDHVRFSVRGGLTGSAFLPSVCRKNI